MSLLKKLGFLSIFTIPALIVWGYYMGGVWTFSGFIFGYGIIPLLDTIIGKDPENITEESFDKVISNRYFYTVVYAQVCTYTWAYTTVYK
jgi:alkane 1-monooxygenase